MKDRRLPLLSLVVAILNETIRVVVGVKIGPLTHKGHKLVNEEPADEGRKCQLMS